MTPCGVTVTAGCCREQQVLHQHGRTKSHPDLPLVLEIMHDT